MKLLGRLAAAIGLVAGIAAASAAPARATDVNFITDFGFTPTDAYCLVSTCPDFRINVYQMCKIRKLEHVAGAEIPKKYLR